MIQSDAHIGARGNDDGIIAVRIKKDKGHSTGFFLVDSDETSIYPVGLQGTEEPFTERIIANTSSHGDCCTEARNRHRLVCSLAAWNKLEGACSEERFAQRGNASNTYNLVHSETTDNENLVLHHFCALCWLYLESIRYRNVWMQT